MSRLLSDAANREATIHRSKAVGEPPLMLAMSVFHAVRDAVAGCSDSRLAPRLASPATPERILTAVSEIRGRRNRPAAAEVAAAS